MGSPAWTGPFLFVCFDSLLSFQMVLYSLKLSPASLPLFQWLLSPGTHLLSFDIVIVTIIIIIPAENY